MPESLIELLETWMAANRISPLDGTISCKTCWAMVLEENAEHHKAWHRTHSTEHSSPGMRWDI